MEASHGFIALREWGGGGGGDVSMPTAVDKCTHYQ